MLISLSLFLSLLSFSKAGDKCYGLAFSSGDESAAYQVGALSGLIKNLPADQVAYSAVSGVQGGAINAALLARHEVGSEKDAVTDMQNFWMNASQSKLYQDWKGGIPEGLIYKGGLYDSSPLKTFLDQEFNQSLATDRSLTIGLVDVLSGDFKDFTEKDLSASDLVNVLYASMSVPGYFEPVEAFGTSWFDGSAIWDIDITSVVNKCKWMGATGSDIVIDVIMVDNSTLAFKNTSEYNSLDMLWRTHEIQRYYGTFDALLRAQFAYPDVQFRYVIGPSDKLPENRIHVPLSMNQDQMKEMFQMGEQDAINLINLGDQAVLPELLKLHKKYAMTQ